MPARLLSVRESLLWTVFFAVAASVLVVTGFASSDPDSGLYAGIADRLAQQPPHKWIAPEWWGFWPDAQMTGLFREHPAGIFVMSVVLSLAGIPAAQAAYVIGIAAGLGSLWLMGGLIRRFTSVVEARAALVLLQLMPVAFIFRVRANHEYPMLFCLLLALTGMAWIADRRPIAYGIVAVAAGLVGGLLIKGIFVALIMVALGTWILLNPLRTGRGKYIVALSAGIVAMAAAAWGYDRLYFNATGETFWAPYWQRQLGPLTILTPLEGASTLASHVLFYVTRLIWHPAPWSVALIVAAWKWRDQISRWWRLTDDPAGRGLRFVIVFAALSIMLLSSSSRFAERYAFSVTYAVGCAGVVAALSLSPRLLSAMQNADRRFPYLPALVWLLLVMMRLGFGPLLPRLS